MHKTKILKTPQHIKKYKNNKIFVGIDYGIITTIKWLWKNRIDTLGSCCGRGRTDDNRPNVVLPECYTDKDIDYIVSLIKKVDDRDWCIMQWRNIEVSKNPKPKRPFFIGKDKLFPIP